jgi:hypothetical protein
MSFLAPGIDPRLVPVTEVVAMLDEHHYLGAPKRGVAWLDGFGCLVFANPNSRRLPQGRWLELIRWCLRGVPNSGSTQWAQVSDRFRELFPGLTTIISYSDPAAGHDGALYRACNWLWAPTWHRLRPPPSGNGNWGSGAQAVKDRWVFCLARDDERAKILNVRDSAICRKYPWAEFVEPRWKRGRPSGGGGNWAMARDTGLIVVPKKQGPRKRR